MISKLVSSFKAMLSHASPPQTSMPDDLGVVDLAHESDDDVKQKPFFARRNLATATAYAVGQELTGRVVRATEAGLDIALPNGEVGFVVRQEIHWLTDPIEYKPGANVNVVVLACKPDRALFLSIKKFRGALHSEEFINSLSVGSRVTGRIKGIKDYGVFVMLGPGVDALLHCSSVPDMSVYDRSLIGSAIDVVVTRIDFAAHRIQVDLAPQTARTRL